MAEYINKKTAISLIKQYGHDAIDGGRYSLDTVDDCIELANCIKALPAADVAPVVHGRWEWLGPNRLVTDCMCGTCSACKVRSKYIVNTMLRPNCGAKMDMKDGGDNDAVD